MSEPKPKSPVISQPPFAISDVPPSAERMTSAIHALADAYPSAWGDRMLLALATLPLDAGAEAIVAHVLDAAFEILPEHSLGACLVSSDGASRTIVRCGPPGDEAMTPPDPARLFPRRRHERTITIDPETGSSFHVGVDSPTMVTEVASESRFVERVATVLGGVMRQVAITERARQHAAELRALQAQIIQSEKLASLGQLAAGVVHELNNPLTSIVAYSDYLRKKGEREHADPTDVERLRRIGEAADRILRFSRDLVEYARPSAGVAASVPIHEVLDQSLVFCEHVLATSGVTVERAYRADPARVRAVAGELTQIFVNLVTNACHAMPALDGRLVIATMNEEGGVRVDFTDNGHGMDAELLAKVFEPFFTTKSEGRGTGLGLSIVRNIVQRHGGTIRVESDGETGSRFILVLPSADGAPLASTSRP